METNLNMYSTVILCHVWKLTINTSTIQMFVLFVYDTKFKTLQEFLIPLLETFIHKNKYIRTEPAKQWRLR